MDLFVQELDICDFAECSGPLVKGFSNYLNHKIGVDLSLYPFFLLSGWV